MSKEPGPEQDLPKMVKALAESYRKHKKLNNIGSSATSMSWFSRDTSAART